MKRSILLLMVLMAAHAAWAQDSERIRIVPEPMPAVPAVSTTVGVVQGFALPGGPGTTAIDHDGNLFIFDVTFSVPTPAEPRLSVIGRAAKTHLTVITSSGTRMNPVDYDGSFEVLGAGRYAVYAFTTAYGNGPTFVPARRLVAFSLIGGVPISPLPGVELSISSDVKISKGESGAPDVISSVDLPVRALVRPNATVPPVAAPRFARLVKYRGGPNFEVGTAIEVK